MRRSSLTVPLRRDPSSRFLPWITAFMVYLAVLSLAGIVLIEGAASRWEQGGLDHLTVQYVPPPDTAISTDDAVAELVVRIEAMAGVAAARPLAEAELIALLEPWLGDGSISAGLPLPRLIDVEPAADETLDLGALAVAVAETMPGARLDDPRDWLDELASLARTVQAVAAVIVLLVVGAAVATVVVTTQMGLAVHREVIEVLHLIGARDSYVAGQFERHALVLGLRGAALGFGLAVATLFGLGGAAAAIEAPLLPAFAFEAWGWGALGALPLAMALVVMATARLTVLRALARMP